MGRLGLLRLASPALPIGAFAWSGGLEAAVEAGCVRDVGSAGTWLQDGLSLAQARWDMPIVARCFRGFDMAGEADVPDMVVIDHWNSIYLAARETAELRAETLQLGGSLLKLLRALPTPPAIVLPTPVTLPLAWALAAHTFQADLDECLLAWAFAWVENQLAVLGKAVPLGQQALQGLLAELSRPEGPIDHAVAYAKCCGDADLVSSLPGLALLSAGHETQYTRLFRS